MTEVIKFIEEYLIKGKLVVNDLPLPEVKYIPYELAKEIPFYISSSVVTELAPLLLYLQSSLRYNLLIIEEPEAHLHPHLQKVITQALIRLVHKGLPVWATTHSDTILQTVNNMIKLNHHSQRESLMEKYGYTGDDLLNDNDIAVYQFRVTDDEKTEVKKLELTPYGFAVPTFNETLMDLLQETKAFEEDE